MIEPSIEQIRNFRLHSHHLDAAYQKTAIQEIVGACGMQNSPPGAWETALYNRVPGCSLSTMEHLLYQEKTLLQAWSLRGAPIVFPTSCSAVFLSALIAHMEEPWIYTNGISLALDFLQMTFDDVFIILKQVIPNLDDHVILSKNMLDQTLAAWMLPLLPPEKQVLWNHSSMYGSPDKQTVGGAVVSFLLRPCSLHGCIVFGERLGIYPTFTSYKNWLGCTMIVQEDTSKKLVRKYLHCYGPTTLPAFIKWLGCAGKQGRRLWDSVLDEIEPVKVLGKKAFILSTDKEQLFSPVTFKRELLLLGPHDPYLDQRDREIIQPDCSLHNQIWRLVSNPGAIIYRGEVIGIWLCKQKSTDMNIKMILWSESVDKTKLAALAKQYADFRQHNLITIEFQTKARTS